MPRCSFEKESHIAKTHNGRAVAGFKIKIIIRVGDMKYNWFNVSNEDRKKWEGICQPRDYQIISGNEIPYILNSVLPEALTRKYDSVLIAGSATPDGKVYFMANGNRIDVRGSAVDQMPFGLVFIGNMASGSACLIQHGNWENRSIAPPEDFWAHISGSGIASYFPLSELPCAPSGKLADLKSNSQHAAFGKLVEVLKDNVGE